MALVISEIKLYEMLKAKIGEQEAEAFVQILETKVDNRLQEKTNVFATKEDVAKLEVKIAESKVDIIKWLIGTGIAIVGVLIAFIKLSH